MGDGAVACEMADIWSSLGSKVTILSRHEKILERFEPFVGDQLAAALEIYHAQAGRARSDRY